MKKKIVKKPKKVKITKQKQSQQQNVNIKINLGKKAVSSRPSSRPLQALPQVINTYPLFHESTPPPPIHYNVPSVSQSPVTQTTSVSNPLEVSIRKRTPVKSLYENEFSYTTPISSGKKFYESDKSFTSPLKSSNNPPENIQYEDNISPVKEMIKKINNSTKKVSKIPKLRKPLKDYTTPENIDMYPDNSDVESVINPYTRRHIQKGGITHKNLIRTGKMNL